MINLNIEVCFISKKYRIKDYDKLSLTPYYNYNDIEFYEDKFILRKKDSNSFVKDDFEVDYQTVRYLSFMIKDCNNCDVIFTTHNNYRKVKLWQNDKFESFFDEWYCRNIIKITSDAAMFLLEVFDMAIPKPIFISINDVNAELISDPFVIIDEKRDVKELYIVANNNQVDSFNNVSFSLRTNNYHLLEKEFICHAVYKDIYIESDDNIKILDSFNIKINDIITYNVSKIILENKDLEMLLFFVYEKDEKDLRNSKAGIRFCLSKQIDNSLTNVTELLHEIVDAGLSDWQMNLYECETKYIEQMKFSQITKCYILENLLFTLRNLKKYLGLNDYLLSSGLKTISIKSEIDNNHYKFIIYAPNDISQISTLPVIFILSSFASKAYISEYASMYPNGYLILEISTRGKHFGNYIADYSVLEVMNFLSKHYNIDKERMYLFAYSSSGTVAISLMEKYPHIFTAALTVSCLCNVELLRNTKYNKIINICGELDRNLDSNFYDKVEIFNEAKYSHNIMVSNVNDYTATFILRNKQLIDQVLCFKKSENDGIEYTSNSLLFAGTDNIKIFKKIDTNFPASFNCEYVNKKIVINTKNISLIKIINIDFELYDEEKKLVFFGNKNKDYLLSIIDDSIIEVDEISEYELATYKLEILNMYFGGLQIVYNSSYENFDNVTRIAKPRSLVAQAYIDVNYPINEFKDAFLNLGNNNYLFINCDVNEYINKSPYFYKYISTFDAGFYYDNKYYQGNFSIMQVLPNLSYLDKFCVFINYNDKVIHSQNLFLRKIIIPSDYSTNQSIYRNCAIIYYENQYYIVRAYGSPLELYDFANPS